MATKRKTSGIRKCGYAVVFVSAVIASWWITRPSDNALDPLVILKSSQSLIEVPNDAEVDVRIEVVNHSSSPTVLLSAMPSCCCLGVFDERGQEIAWPLTVPPRRGQEFLLKAAAETRVGEFSVGINFLAEHRGKPFNRTAQFLFDAVPRVLIVPNEVILSSDEFEWGVDRNFYVGGGMPLAPDIEKVFVSHPEHMAAEIVTPPEPVTADFAMPHRLWSPSASIRVRTNPSLARVGERAAVYVSVAGQDKPIEIPIYVQPAEPVGVQPREVVLSRLDEAQLRTFVITGLDSGTAAAAFTDSPAGVEIASERVVANKRIVKLRFRTSDMKPESKVLFLAPGQAQEAFSVDVRVDS